MVITNEQFESCGLKRLGHKIVDTCETMFYELSDCSKVKISICNNTENSEYVHLTVYNWLDGNCSFNVKSKDDAALIVNTLHRCRYGAAVCDNFKHKLGFIPHPYGLFWINGYMADFSNDNLLVLTKCENGESMNSKEFFLKTSERINIVIDDKNVLKQELIKWLII